MICLMDRRVIVVELQGNVNLLTSDGKLQKRLSKHGVAWCVTQINMNTIAITYPHEKAIKIFNLEKLQTMLRVSYTDYMGKAVRCYEGSDKQIWQYKQDLSGPWGLSDDNIIVADFESSRIIIISKDGQNSKVLMSEEDRLTDLKCICFNHNEYSGFICDDNGRYLTNFNLSQG
ncbi:unnamed protein product [Mytilus edulis]|uniref:Uncharacterized protein n=1 Tax=Mytilus edulis TaxID=6550 RepID=A0A8S3R4I7_MYTED|nr:unnamed protein product [Mytilus edulis]